jgi:hypothetical protein
VAPGTARLGGTGRSSDYGPGCCRSSSRYGPGCVLMGRDPNRVVLQKDGSLPDVCTASTGNN